MGKVYFHVAEFSDQKGIIKGKPKFEVKEFAVLAENDECLVVDDRWFTSVRKAKDDFYACLEKPCIGVTCADTVWGTGVRYSMYSVCRASPSTVRAQIRSAINKKVGFFMDKIDLSFIKDDKP
jgi:hypothetical protein